MYTYTLPLIVSIYITRLSGAQLDIKFTWHSLSSPLNTGNTVSLLHLEVCHIRWLYLYIITQLTVAPIAYGIQVLFLRVLSILY